MARLGTVCVLHTRAVPLLFDGLSDSLFRHYLSTARRSPFFRSWKFAVFLDLIFALPGQLSIIAWRCIRTPAIVVAAAESLWSSADARTKQSPNPHFGSFYNWILLNNYSLLEYPHPAMPFNYESR